MLGLVGFKADYDAAVAELRVNSRPLISSLTDIAAENPHFAHDIADVILRRILSNPREEKLPVLYLMDSIVKNLGGAFVAEFGRSVAVVFLHALDAAHDDLPTRQALLHLFRTWQEAQTFPGESLRQIDAHLRAPARSPGGAGPPPGLPALASSPPLLPSSSPVLPGLMPVGVGVGAGTVAEALGELEALEVQTLRKLHLHYQTLRGGPIGPAPAGGELLAQKAALVSELQALLQAQLHRHLAPSPDILHALEALRAIVQLQTSLRQAQAPSPPASAGPGPAGTLPTGPTFPSQSPLPGAQPLHSGMAMSGTATPGPGVAQLSFANPDAMRRRVEAVVGAVYGERAHQCAQCGLRFNDTAKLAQHLDWHFEANRREQNKAKRVTIRPWFLSEADWLDTSGGLATAAETSTSTLATSGGLAQATSSIAAAPTALGPSPSKRRSRLANCVPVNEEQLSCAACGEKFEQFYDEEAEEWMFRNARLHPVSARIYHLPCYPQTDAMDEEPEEAEGGPGVKRRATEVTAHPDDLSSDPSLAPAPKKPKLQD